MKMTGHAAAMAVLAVVVSLATNASADVLYDSTVFNAVGGGLTSTTWTDVDAGFILMDDISVPAGGWVIDTVSNYFGTLNSPTATTANLVVFPKALGEVNAMDFAIEVPITVETLVLTDSETGWSRYVEKVDASGLNMALAPGDYWIGMSPIEAAPPTGWTAWGSYAANGDRPIWYSIGTNTYEPLFGLWNGPDQMLQIQGVPEPATFGLATVALLVLSRRRSGR
ncbi:MAG: hypothetical protein PVJ57_03060 [Phycisphaerae bacterium]|jgi:hypothetical protein